MKNSKFLRNVVMATALLSTAPVMAKKVTVSITNLTFGSYFTPLLISAHNGSEAQRMFEVGKPADADVELMAEKGDIGPLAGKLETAGATIFVNPAGQEALDAQESEIINRNNTVAPFLGNGSTVKFDLYPAKGQKYLSVSAMILPSNDAFVGLDSYKIPKKPGTYRVFLNGYDAGTEDNDEKVDNIPNPGLLDSGDGAGLGIGGTGVDISATVTNSNIHLHRGNLGDFDSTGGISDMDARLHRWNNPVAVVTVVVGK